MYSKHQALNWRLVGERAGSRQIGLTAFYYKSSKAVKDAALGWLTGCCLILILFRIHLTQAGSDGVP